MVHGGRLRVLLALLLMAAIPLHAQTTSGLQTYLSAYQSLGVYNFLPEDVYRASSSTGADVVCMCQHVGVTYVCWQNVNSVYGYPATLQRVIPPSPVVGYNYQAHAGRQMQHLVADAATPSQYPWVAASFYGTLTLYRSRSQVAAFYTSFDTLRPTADQPTGTMNYTERYGYGKAAMLVGYNDVMHVLALAPAGLLMLSFYGNWTSPFTTVNQTIIEANAEYPNGTLPGLGGPAPLILSNNLLVYSNGTHMKLMKVLQPNSVVANNLVEFLNVALTDDERIAQVAPMAVRRDTSGNAFGFVAWTPNGTTAAEGPMSVVSMYSISSLLAPVLVRAITRTWTTTTSGSMKAPLVVSAPCRANQVIIASRSTGVAQMYYGDLTTVRWTYTYAKRCIGTSTTLVRRQLLCAVWCRARQLLLLQ